MATAAELAAQRHEDRLRRSGLDADGNPVDTDDRPDTENDDRLSQDDPPAGEADDGAGDDDDDRQQEDRPDDEVARLRQELQETQERFDALHGRLAPAQQDLDHYRSETRRLQLQLNEAQGAQNQEIEDLRRQLEERDSQLNVEELLTEDERRDLDPALINVVTKLADAVARRRAPKIDARAEALRAIQEHEKQQVDRYRQQVLTDPGRGLNTLPQLSQDSRFLAWTREDDNDIDSVLNSLLNAQSTEEVDRYARIASRKIANYRSRSTTRNDKKPAGSDANTRLRTGMRRESGARLSDRERNEKLAEAQRLARSNNAADRQKAKALLDSI